MGGKMKERILNYRKKTDELLEQPSESINWAHVITIHLDQIAFFQHERLIHLIVTALVAVLMVMCIGIAMIAGEPLMFLLALPLFILLVPYISHYYLLENEVQKMYGQYDKMVILRDNTPGESHPC